MNEQERWSTVPNLSDKIEVSTLGNVRVTRKDGSCVSPVMNTYNGMLNFSAFGDTIQVHRAVATAFIPNSEGYKVVKHRNGDNLDNRVENLYWSANSRNAGSRSGNHTMIACLEQKIIYDSIRSVSYITTIPDDCIAKSIEEGTSICGLTFRKVEKGDKYEGFTVRYLNQHSMIDILKNCESIEDYHQRMSELTVNRMQNQ